jgi:phosphoenolpyruvate synthase/pyruvate phosphate dikinase
MLKYVVTLNNVNQADIQGMGFRAVDLANLKEKRLNIPLSFVVNNSAFDAFLDENGLRAKVDGFVKDKRPADAYLDIVELFGKTPLPKELEAELSDAYESLTIEPGTDAGSIVSKWDFPFVTLFRSPAYLLSTEDDEGILQNVRGKENIAAALKFLWASLYSPRSASYRDKSGIKGSLAMGAIVQKMRKIKQSAIAYSRSEMDEKSIVVKSFFGMPDYGFEKEVLGKDEYEVDMNSLMLTKGEVNSQEFAIERNFDTEELTCKQLGEDGGSQKINDRMISELARLVKRSKSFIGKDLKMYFGIKDDYVFVFLANRLMGGTKRILSVEDEVEVKFDAKGGKTITEKQEITGFQQECKPTFEMPKILSIEEVKEALLKERQVDDWSEQEAASTTEEPPRVEVYEEKTVQEEEVEKEINLMEEVLKIKEVTERMEEHALNNNKESYDKEARVLKGMIKRIREGE